MEKRNDRVGQNGAVALAGEEGDRQERPRSVELAARGIRTSSETVNFLNALLGDLMEEKVTTRMAGVATNITGKIIATAQLALKYGTAVTPGGDKELVLAHEPNRQDRIARLEREFAEIKAGAN